MQGNKNKVAVLVRRVRRAVGRLRASLYSPLDWQMWVEQRQPKSALAVIAHPDDETFCSGLLCDLASRGAKTYIAVLTNGEGAALNGMTPREIGEVRAEEMRKAAGTLRAKGVFFLGYIDLPRRGMQPVPPLVNMDEAVQKVHNLILQTGAALVLTHGSDGEYGHPAHVLTNRILRRAVGELCDRSCSCLTFNAWVASHPLPNLLNPTDPPQIVFNAERCREQRLQSLQAHQTQKSVFEQFVAGPLGSFILATSTETYSFLKAGTNRLAKLA